MTEERKEDAVRRHLRGAAREERRQQREARRGKRDRKREVDDWSLAEDGWCEHDGGSRRPERARLRRAEKRRAPSHDRESDPDLAPARVTGLARGRALVVMDGDADRATVSAELAPRLASTPLVVGDHVAVQRRSDGFTRIEEVRPRRSLLSRTDPGNAHRERLIAANVDLGVIVASASAPPFRPGLIDRLFIALERGGVEAVVCVNKIDLCTTPREHERIDEALESHRALGAAVVQTSVAENRGLEELRSLLHGKTSVFVGHSGVGKSSLSSALAGSELARAGEVRSHDGRGRHTTTSSSLFELEGGVCLIDTPGIRAFGLHGVGPRELSRSFPGFEAFLGGCRFGDCSHLHEPDCAVRSALEAGRLPKARYAIYARLMDGSE